MTGQRTFKVLNLSPFVLFIAGLAVLPAFVGSATAQNPVPFVDQPLVPDAVAPGGSGFTLIVSGTGFVATSVVNWDGSPRATTFFGSSKLTATILASDIATASTASVTVVNPSPGGGVSSPLFFPIAALESSVSFGQADFASAGGNITVVTADFNGDGKLDLATADYYDSVVRIFLGNGDGTFRAGQTYAACSPHGLAVGDFKGDGNADLVVAGLGCGQVKILLGKGDGTFSEGGTFSTGGGAMNAPETVAVGDFNGDGKLDLVTADAEFNQVSVLIGKGDGTFQRYVAYPTGSEARKVVAGDFNRDGHLDLAVSTGVGVSIFLGNGDGTFQPQVSYPVGSTDNPYMLTADLNGDGILDLAVASTGQSTGTYTAGSVSVMLGKGDGTFNSAVLYPTNGYSAAVAAADFKGNGVLDLVTTNYYTSTISMLSGNGDGTFGPYVNYPGDEGARGIVVADFNGDGRLDLAVGDQFVDFISIYLQTPAGGTTPTSTAVTSSLNPSTAGQSITFTATVTSNSGTPPNGETVTFYNGSAVLGTGALSGGVASLATSSLSAGIHSITASYAGDANFAASTSGALRQVVNATTRSATATTLVSSLNPSIYGQNVTWTAIVTTSGPVPPTGKVNFVWNGYNIGTATLNASGVATLTRSKLNADTYPLTAVYVGDANSLRSTSSVVSQVITQATSAATLTSSPNPSSPGELVTLTATITSLTVLPAGPVTFTVGKRVMGTAELNGGKAKFTTSTLPVGTTAVKATYYGDSNVAGSSATVTQIVQP